MIERPEGRASEAAESAPVVACRAIRPGAALPRRMTAGSSGFDLAACLEESVRIEPGRRALVPTGIVLAIPAGYEGTVRPRSGLALRHGIGVLNSPGTIDSDYRGELCVILMNWGDDPFEIQSGDRIAQIVFQAVAPIAVAWADVATDTARGEGGFGHTGAGSNVREDA